MSDVRYVVEVAYQTSGSLVSMNAMRGVQDAEKAAKKLKAEARAFGESVASHAKSFTGAFNHAFDSIAMGIARGVGVAAVGVGTALTAGFGLGIREMMRFNEELELSQISIAAISRATGESSNMAGGLRIAGSVIREMRKDAAMLPGSIHDLQKSLTLVMPALGHAGVGAFGAEKIAARLMAAGKIEGIPDPSVVAREYAAMVEGRARTAMPLFAKMLPLLDEFGIHDTKSFNALSMQERMRLTNLGVEKLTGREDDPNSALAVYGRSWNAIKETAIDNIRMGVGAVGGDLFEHIKDKVAAFNDIKKGERGLPVLERMGKFGEDASRALVDGFEKAFKLGNDFLTSDWIPLIRNFTREMWWGIRGSLRQIEHVFGSGRVKSFLGDPMAFEKLARVATMLGAARIGSSALGMGAGMLPGLMSAMGGGAAGATALAGIAAPAIGVIAAFALAVEGAVHASTDVTSAFHTVARYLSIELGHTLTATSKNFLQIWDNIAPVRDLLGTALLGSLTLLGKGIEWLSEVVRDGTSLMKMAFDSVRTGYGVFRPGFNTSLDDDVKEMYDEVSKNRPPLFMNKVFDAKAFAELENESKPPTHTTHIHNVNIAVNSNQDPNRIARRTMSLMLDVARNPRTAMNSGNPIYSRGS